MNKSNNTYKHLYNAFEQYKYDLQTRYNKAIGSDRHTPIIDIRYAPNKIEIAIVAPEELQFIEYGRGSGKFPPVPKIQDWVQRHITTDLPRVKTLSYLIGRKISEQGTTGKHILEPILDELNIKYSQVFNDALNEDLRAILGQYHHDIKTKLQQIF